jgi:5-carboxymethyl-2-hydroxymuconate isomerase
VQVGRPSEYTQELGDKLCSVLASGVSLRTACEAEEFPDRTTVFRWLRTYEQFRNQYARAKEEAADAFVEELIDISDGSGDVQRDKLKVDTRKWIASKLKPKKYGEKLEHSGPDGGPLKILIDRAS